MLRTIRETNLGKWITTLILAFIAVGFIFWGIDFNLGTSSYAARVNGEEVSLEDYQRQARIQQTEYQAAYRVELNDELRREIRSNVLEGLIRDELLEQRLGDRGYRVSDERLTEFVRSVPQFQIDGEFSLDVYRAQLLNQGLTPAGFERRQRLAMEMGDLRDGIARTTFYTPAEFRRYIELANERREIAWALFSADSFANDVAVDYASIAAFYEQNRSLYRTEDAVDLQYIELKRDDVAAEIDLSEDALRDYYEQEKQSFQTEEERRARHILIATDGDEAAAQEKAAALLAELRAGADFAELAAANSDDPGTKNEGGDLGWVSRGQLVGPFEDALFAMSTGELVGPVKTQFGFHVIQLEDIRAGELKTFEQVRAELAETLSQNRAEDLFFEKANELADRSFEAFNELESVSESLGLPLKTLTGFTRSGGFAEFPFSAPIADAAFSEAVLESGENSSLIDLGGDDVVVLRVTDHRPPVEQPLEAVRDQIRQRLIREAAEQKAREQGEALLAEMGAAADIQSLVVARGATWNEPAWVGRSGAEAPTEVVARAFREIAPADGDQARTVGVPLASGDYAVLVLSGVQPGQPEAIARAERDQRKEQLAAQASMFEVAAYVSSLRADARVRIPEDVLGQDF
jgi:peptidyl-prolyl cis-trans isomerase D